jgi:uncharacterized membrane protein
VVIRDANRTTRGVQRWRHRHSDHHHGARAQGATQRAKVWRFEAAAADFSQLCDELVYLGIYWNNHHHLFQVVDRVNGRILWANLHLLFWLSLIPFATGWMGENSFAPATVALYGVNLLLSGLAFLILQIAILRAPGGNPALCAAIGRDLKGKASLFLYSAGVALSFLSREAACAIYVLVALIWLVPDPRIERAFSSPVGNDRDSSV